MLFRKLICITSLPTMLLLATAAIAQQNWEYLVKTYPLVGNDSALTQKLNELGKQQWELVNCTEGSAELTCIFKRAIKNG